ncbi:M24 family metallopeptidase [Verrucomicrobiota bacterium]
MSKSKKLHKNILLLGTADDCPDIEYATGFRSLDPVIFLQKGKKGYLVVPEFEQGRALKANTHRRISSRSGHTIEVLTPLSLGMGRKRHKSLSFNMLRLLEKTGTKSIKIPFSFPYGIAGSLIRAGIRVSVLENEVFPERAVKTMEEIKMIKESQQAAVIAMRAATAMIADATADSAGFLKIQGKRLTSEAVKQVISRILVEHNCFCREIIVAGGLQAADPHVCGKGPLRLGEAIVIDIFPQHMEHGYWGDLTRTVIKGKPSRNLRKMYQAVKSAQSIALNHVKAGVKCSTVHQCAVKEFERRDFQSEVINGRREGFVHSTGHGVGLAIHESPSLVAQEDRLRSGNVITVEPGLYYSNIGGIRIEDTVVVTPKGWRYLVPCEKKFEL